MAKEKKHEHERRALGADDRPDSGGVSLPDLVQMECLGRNSSILELFHEYPIGRIYIDQGQIVHAVCGEIIGERAFQKLLAVTDGTFELLEFEVPPERTINRIWELLLGEALRQRVQLVGRAQSGKKLSAAASDGASSAGQAVELLVCSGAGEIFYSWQCSAAADRLVLLQKIARCAEKLVPELQLGRLDRVEIQTAAGRTVLQPRADRLIFARLATGAKQP